MTDTKTANLQIIKPGRGSPRWDVKINAGLDLIDAAFGTFVSAVDDLPTVYVVSDTFNGPTGRQISLPNGVDNINEYAVEITPTSRAAAIGDIHVERGAGSFTVKCAESNTSDSFTATIYYIGEVSSYGGSQYRRWYVSPDGGISDHGDDSDAGSLAWIADQISTAPAIVELPGNHTYTISQNLELPANIALHPQPGAILNVDSGYTLTINGDFEAGLYKCFAGDGDVIFSDGSVDCLRLEWWENNDTPGTTEMSGAAQAAVDCAKAIIAGGVMAPPILLAKSSYLFSYSIDVTFSASPGTNLGGISFKGQGRYATKIIGTLVEAYPVLDYTGNTHGTVERLTIDASGSATACLLAASPSAAKSAGNNIKVEDCLLALDYAGVGAAFVGYNSDLPVLINTECRGPQGATWGFGKPAAVTSKFQTLHTADSTKGVFDSCIFLGETGSAFEYTGGAQVSLKDCYAALVNTGTGENAVEISSTSGSSGNSVYAYNLRTENQSSNGLTNGIKWTASSLQGGHIDGAINNEAMIYVASGQSLLRYSINVSEAVATNPLFAGAGDVAECHINTNATVNSLTGDFDGNIVIGEMPFAQVVQDSERNLVYKDGIWHDARRPYLYPPGQAATIMRANASFGLTQFNPAYTGGSGEQLIGTFEMDGDLLTQPDGVAPKCNIGIRIIGDTTAANSSGQLKLVLSNGGSTQTILNHTGIPSGAGSIDIDIIIINVSTDSMRVCVTSRIAGDTFTKYTNMNGSPISVADDIDLLIYETNDGTNGLRPFQAIGYLL